MRNRSALFASYGLFLACAIVVDTARGAIVLSDTLQGSTTGTRAGGSFVAGGWQVTNQYDSIYWHVGTYSKGAFEYNVRGLPSNSCPGGAGGKNEISHMYDYTFGNSDVNYTGGYRDGPYKQFLRKQCESGKMNTMEILWVVTPNFLEDDSGALSWDVNTTYLFRNEWENTGGNAICKTIRNGVLIRTQTLPGSWNPGGQSVRIAASPRRADEGANTGTIYSNVKVEDLSSSIPAAPTIAAPTNGETINTMIAYVQWTGDSHTLYQVRVNTQNNPDSGIFWDSQQVASTRNFTWTGSLNNNTIYYLFARLGTGSGWGPWSANGRTFTVNTAFVPPGANLVRINGNTFRDNNGPFIGLGATYMRGLQRCKWDRPRFISDCAALASKDFNYIRTLSMVDWDTLEIAPVAHTNSAGHAVAAWPDYAQQFKDAIDIAYSNGLLTEVTIFAGAQYVMPSKSTRITHLNNVLSYIVGREHKILHLEVANEAWQNGFPGSTGDADVREFAQLLANGTTIPVALSSPSDTSDSGIVAYHAGSAADLTMVHFSRNIGTNEGGWLPVRDSYRTGLGSLPPVSSNEPIGAGSSVSTENDPIKLCMAAAFGYTANLISYVYHSRAGVFGWTGCCPVSGTETPFETSAGYNAYQHLPVICPPDLGSWERNDGKVTASPFTSYSMGQANKWWTEVGGSTNGCIRNISAIKGGEFVTTPIGILSGGLELEARRPMNFQVYNPLTGAVAYNLTKNIGDHFTLVQGPGAYIIKGVFTDIVVPTTEVSIDLGTPDVATGMTHPVVGDGDTTPFTIGGRTGRKNVNPAEDFYFYFGVSDAFAFQGSKPDLYVMIDYYDAGTSTLTLQYDATAAAYQNTGSVVLTNTNTWKTTVWHVTDAYLGNRQNSGADFRIASAVGNTFYLDKVLVTTLQPGPPVIAEVSPDPAGVYPGFAYTKQLELSAGSPAPTWSVVNGPAGLQVNAAGLVTGWTPGVLGDYTLEVQATNSQGTDTEAWTVRVLSVFDFDLDGDADMSDFGRLQGCFSGSAVPHQGGCEAIDSDNDGDVDMIDFNSFLPCMFGAGNIPGC